MRPRISLTEDNLVHGVALLTAFTGLVNLLSAVIPSARFRLLEQVSPFGVTTGGHLTSALAGFALLVLSVSLWRRKQIGWILTVAILLLSIPAHLLKGLDVEEATLAALLTGLLIYLRSSFHARSDPPSVRQGVLTVFGALAFTLVYGVLGFYLLDRHFNIQFGFWEAFRQTVVMFTEFYDPGLQPIPITPFGRYFADSIYTVGALTGLYALLMLLRPVLTRTLATTEEERARAWEVVRAHGRTALARYTLLDDKRFFFSPGGSVVSYVVENRVALALGEPIGPQADFGATLAAYRAMCSRNDWLPAFYQTAPDATAAFKEAGFDSLVIGQEAVVTLATFTLEGGENKSLRNGYNKMVRNGYHFDVIQPPFSARMLRELNAISDEWLSSRGASEMRFSVGWFDEAYLNTCPILLVRDREGFIEAFANLVPEFQASEVTIDLMRHRAQVEGGLMDFMFVSLFKWAMEAGYATFNLGLSALAGVGEHSDDPVIERALNYIYRNINRVYNFRGLHAFKDKFHPVWSPRYLMYPGPANLPAVSVAILRANLGGGIVESLVRGK